jgi:hypothetical protein
MYAAFTLSLCRLNFAGRLTLARARKRISIVHFFKPPDHRFLRLTIQSTQQKASRMCMMVAAMCAAEVRPICNWVSPLHTCSQLPTWKSQPSDLDKPSVYGQEQHSTAATNLTHESTTTKVSLPNSITPIWHLLMLLTPYGVPRGSHTHPATRFVIHILLLSAAWGLNLCRYCMDVIKALPVDPASIAVIEIGSGTGEALAPIAKSNCAAECLGIDINPKFIE